MAQKILVIDDTETIRLYQQTLLVSEGYWVDTAKDASEGLDKMLTDKPDLVLLDINMPGMDGISCCRLIKNDETLKDIKVVMVTTRSEYENINAAFNAGCDDYVVKPINNQELLSKVKELLKFSELKQLLKA